MNDLVLYFYVLNENSKRFPEWRLGQNHFNTLYELNSELANSIRGEELDPFYKDAPSVEYYRFLVDNFE